MPAIRGFSTLRARSYIFRLPLFTRAIIIAILVFWILGIPSLWDLHQWGSLIPDKVTFATGKFLLENVGHLRLKPSLTLCVAYRLSTFPLIHLNVIHAVLNVVALTPLMERFENEYGTLTSLALFFGRKNTISSAIWQSYDVI
jgi:membrane associated rhomboid family serine protease